MKKVLIAILMATYNGEKYISAQIESLLKQTFSEFVLWVSDDCSTDSTWEILTTYAEQYPDKIKITQRKQNSGSAKYNFLEMMIDIKNDYVMLCDQDDVWLPDKIEKTLVKMEEMEERFGSDVPILVHTDLRVVDNNLEMITPSFRWAMHSDFNRIAFHQVLIQNTVTGCTVMYNQALAGVLDCEPLYCVMHDWWLQLVAAAFGKIGHLDESTVLYRQHGNNAVGAKNVRKWSYRINRFIHGNEVKEAINVTYLQAKSFLQAYYEQLNESQRKTVEKYCAIPTKWKLGKWYAACELKAFKNGLSRNIAYFWFI